MKDKVVLITGGSRGIGFATAKAFLEEGAKVAFFSKNPQNVEKAKNELSQLGEVLALRTDVRNFGEVKTFVDKVIKKFGRIDVLDNNAGIAWSGDFANQEVEETDRAIDTNIKGVLYTTHAVLPQMIKQGSGTIINISSGAGLHGIQGLATYSASKFAVIGFTAALAKEVKDLGIKVFAVCPGRVATDMQVDISGAKIGMSPERVAGKILKLAGPNPRLRSGGCLKVYW